MKRLIPYINHEMRILEAHLQTEESGTKIAIIQGKLSGFHSMFAVLQDIEKDDFGTVDFTAKIPCVYKDDFKQWFCENSDFDVVLGLHVIFNNVESSLKQFNKLAEEKIKNRKDWLFYKAEKGRDLHFTKGWFFAFNILNDWKNAIDNQYEYLSEEKRKSLPFDDEED